MTNNNTKKTNKEMLQEILDTMRTTNQRLDKIEARVNTLEQTQNQKPTKPNVQTVGNPTPQRKELVYQAISYSTDKIKVYTVAGSSGKENSSIRIWFAEKPQTAVLNKLKASAFRYYQPTKEWYAHNVDKAVSLAREIAKEYK